MTKVFCRCSASKNFKYHANLKSCGINWYLLFKQHYHTVPMRWSCFFSSFQRFMSALGQLLPTCKKSKQGVEDMEFHPRIFKKYNSMWKFQGSTKKGVEFLEVVKKIMWNFQLVLALEFNSLTGFGVKLYVLLETSTGKVTNLKIPGVFSKKYVCKPLLR